MSESKELLIRDIKVLQDKIDDNESELEDVRNEIDDKESEINDLRTEIYDLENSVSKLEKKLEDDKDELEDLKRELRASGEDIDMDMYEGFDEKEYQKWSIERTKTVSAILKQEHASLGVN